MITCNLMGGLGNQIFQIFATISYGIKTHQQFKFINSKTLGGGTTTLRNTYWDSFFSRLRPFLFAEYPKLDVIKEKDFTFNELPLHKMTGADKNILIYGYFQSYKYFESSYETIYRIIGLENMKHQLLLKMNYNMDYFKNCISMHFRIGDYKQIQHCHPIMTKEYYYRCINYIKSADSNTNFTIMYFCEDNDLDDVNIKIQFLSQQFPLYTFVRGEKSLADWEQLLLMSCCHHNIIANSSFSWWSAYFNKWEDKIICYPSIWFGHNIEHNTKDLCPPIWRRIES
jgi:hypothetical protein